MNKLALFAVLSFMMVPASAFAFTMNFKDVPHDVDTSIEIIDDSPVLFWNSEVPAKYVNIQGIKQVLTAADIQNDDTRFYNVDSIEQDISRIAFNLGSSQCVWVIEDYDGGAFDAKRLVCS